MNFGFLAAIAVLLIATAAIADDPSLTAGPKHTLAYKFKPGEIIRTSVLQQVRLDTTIAGSTQTAETVSGSMKVWKIQSVAPNGEITFEHSVESVNMRNKITGRAEITYNSKTDAKPPRDFEQVAKSIGVPLSVITVNPAGKVTKRVEQRPGVQSDNGNQILTPLPAEPVAVGESWNEPSDVVVSLEDSEKKLIKTRQHYTLEKVSNGVATIKVATQILTPNITPKVQSQLVQRLTEGTIRFDIDAGRVLSQQIDLDQRVLGFQGNDSSLHYLGRFTEEYQPAEEKTAAKPVKTATKPAPAAPPAKSATKPTLRR